MIEEKCVFVRKNIVKIDQQIKKGIEIERGTICPLSWGNDTYSSNRDTTRK